MKRNRQHAVKIIPWLTAKEIHGLLRQQETKVKGLAHLIRLVPWMKDEVDTDSTVPHEKFPTPLTVLTGGDWWKPDYHFIDSQGDNEGVLPPGVRSVMKVHGREEFRVEVEPDFARSNEARSAIKKLGGKWESSRSRIYSIAGRKLGGAITVLSIARTQAGPSQ